MRTPRAQLEQDAQSCLHLINFDFAVKTGNTLLVLYKQVQDNNLRTVLWKTLLMPNLSSESLVSISVKKTSYSLPLPPPSFRSGKVESCFVLFCFLEGRFLQRLTSVYVPTRIYFAGG